jgi:hypothetical protein
MFVGCIIFNPNIPNDSIVTYKRKHVHSAEVVLQFKYIQLSPAEYGVTAAIDAASKSVTDIGRKFNLCRS